MTVTEEEVTTDNPPAAAAEAPFWATAPLTLYDHRVSVRVTGDMWEQVLAQHWPSDTARYRDRYTGLYRSGGGYRSTDPAKMIYVVDTSSVTAWEPGDSLFDEVRAVVARAQAANDWEDGQADSVSNGIMTHFVDKLLAQEEPVSLREAARKGWNNFALGEQKEMWEALVIRLREKIKAMPQLDDAVFQTRLERASFGHNRASTAYVKACLAAMRTSGDTYLNLQHAAIELDRRYRQESNGSRLGAYGNADIREFLRTNFPAGHAQVPDDIAAVTDVEQLQRLLADQMAREVMIRGYFHDKADERGMCGEYDNIARVVGWPGRPKKWDMYVQAKLKHVATNDWIRRNIGGETEVEGVIKRIVSHDFHFPMWSDDEPDHEELLTKVTTDGTLEAKAKAWLGSDDIEFEIVESRVFR